VRTSPPTAGWYPNPEGAPGQRYWDGATWSIVEIPTTSVHPSPSPVSADERALRRNIWLTLGAAGVIAVWAFAFFATGGSAGERHRSDLPAAEDTVAVPSAPLAHRTLPQRCGAATDQAIRYRTGPAGLPNECAAAFLAEADTDGLVSPDGEAQLLIDAYVACTALRFDGSLEQISAAVRKADPRLAGGYRVLADHADIPAASLARTAHATLCP